MLAFLLLAAGLRIALWLVSDQVLPPSSDESIGMLLAREIARGHFPLLFMAQPYMFPLESYIAALWSWMAPGGAACRLISLTLGLATTVLALLLLPRGRFPLARWLAGLLIVLPSAYLLTFQGFYALPGYSFLLLLTAGLPWLALRTRNRKANLEVILVGLLSGLGFAAHSLSLCASLPALALSLLTARSWPQAGRRLTLVTLALLLGLLPYLAARWTLPGAHEMATATNAFPDMIHRWWGVGPLHALPVALGLLPALHPAIDHETALFPFSASRFGDVLTVLLATVAAWRLLSHGLMVMKGHRPVWRSADLMLAIILLNFTLFAAAPRAHAGSARYMLPAALAVTVLIASLVNHGPRWIRGLGWLAAAMLIAVQVPVLGYAVASWWHPGYALRAGVADLGPVLEILENLDLHAAVASYGVAYRLNYLSDGRLVACQPRNERFHDWPVPFQDKVQAAPRVAYVLTDTVSYLKPGLFEQDLQAARVTASITNAGAFRIYYDFQPLAHQATRAMASAGLSVRACRSEGAERLTDQQSGNPWRLRRHQVQGDFIEFTWSANRAIDHMLITYARRRDRPQQWRITRRHAQQWDSTGTPVAANLQPFELANGHPRYGRSTECIDLEGDEMDGVRLEIDTARPDHDLSIDEISLFERIPSADPASIPPIRQGRTANR